LANFAAHLYGGAATGSVAAIGAYGLGWAGPEYTQVLFMLGVVGGLLPDIDADNSAPVRGFFSIVGVLLAFLVCFSLVGCFPLLELALIWCGVFAAVRYAVLEVFARFTVHRGIWHSWLAVAFSGLATANGAFHLAGLPALESWLAGFFVALGYLTHLCLDELASVDLLGNRLRRSFGTALKPFSLKYPGASLAMAAAVVVTSLPAPPLGTLLEVSGAHGLSAGALQARLLGDAH
jgi:hypothetical protein